MIRPVCAIAALFMTTAPALAQTAPSAQAAHAAIETDHLRIVQVGTNGPPVFLIPGLASPRQVWDGIVPELAKTHRSIWSRCAVSRAAIPAATPNPAS